MVVDRPLGEDEPLGDLGVAQPVRDEAEHLELARRQAGRVRAGRRPRPRGSPRTPRSRSRRATIAAAGRAPSR